MTGRIITDHDDFEVGMEVKLIHCEQGEDYLWEFEVGSVYDIVVNNTGLAVGPADLAGDVPLENYHNWKWEVLVEEPTLIANPSGIHIDDEPQEIPATPGLKLITEHGKMRVGQRVRLIKKEGTHDHWGFKLGETYKVKQHDDNGKIGPSTDRSICIKNWDNWVWELVG